MLRVNYIKICGNIENCINNNNKGVKQLTDLIDMFIEKEKSLYFA